MRHFVYKNYFFGRWGSGFGVCFFEIGYYIISIYFWKEFGYERSCG